MAAPPLEPAQRSRTEFRGLAATLVSELEMRVTVDYTYIGDQGRDEVFVHAAALQHDDLESRVSGTGFPGSPIHVGQGTAAIAITKVPGTGPARSTSVMVCMVSLRRRSAFHCQTFPFTMSWSDGQPDSGSDRDPQSGQAPPL
jgi:hypothetical protein